MVITWRTASFSDFVTLKIRSLRISKVPFQSGRKFHSDYMGVLELFHPGGLGWNLLLVANFISRGSASKARLKSQPPLTRLRVGMKKKVTCTKKESKRHQLCQCKGIGIIRSKATRDYAPYCTFCNPSACWLSVKTVHDLSKRRTPPLKWAYSKNVLGLSKSGLS